MPRCASPPWRGRASTRTRAPDVMPAEGYAGGCNLRSAHAAVSIADLGDVELGPRRERWLAGRARRDSRGGRLTVAGALLALAVVLFLKAWLPVLTGERVLVGVDLLPACCLPWIAEHPRAP